MEKECNEIGKDVVERSKTTIASPRCMLNFLKKMNPEVKKDEPTIQEIEEQLPKVREVISDIKNFETDMNVGRRMGNVDHWRSSINLVGFKLILPPNQPPNEGETLTRRQES
jgi:hypothetical protein